MSCISTNLSGSLEDTLFSSPSCVCSLAHFPLYCFVTLSNFKCICPSGSLRMCAEERFFFLSNTHPHTQNWIQVWPQCLPFISVNSTSYFLAFSPPSFPHCHHICSIFLFQLSFFGSKRRMTKTQTEKQRIVQAEIVGLVHSQCCSNIKVSPPATDSVRRGSA